MNISLKTIATMVLIVTPCSVWSMKLSPLAHLHANQTKKDQRLEKALYKKQKTEQALKVNLFPLNGRLTKLNTTINKRSCSFEQLRTLYVEKGYKGLIAGKTWQEHKTLHGESFKVLVKIAKTYTNQVFACSDTTILKTCSDSQLTTLLENIYLIENISETLNITFKKKTITKNIKDYINNRLYKKNKAYFTA